jgi:sirohydrochlorin cobaltochelatase
MRPGLILLAHGARDARWAAPFEAVAERVRRARPEAEVRLAYQEFMTPSLDQAAAELNQAGCSRVEVLPLFLGAGGHVRQDLPRSLDRLRSASPQVRYTLHPAVGEHDELVNAMAAVAAAVLAGAA